MSTLVNTKLDFGGQRRITNLAAGQAAGEPVVYEQLQSAIEGLSWKDDVRVSPSTNTTISSPGATIDAISMAINDRVLLKSQTNQTENGIYIWNGSAVPMTRAPDANTFDELEGAVVAVTEGTSVGIWRQTQVNGVIGTNNVVFTSLITGSPPSSETTSGIAEIATQAETDAGTDDTRIVTPLKLATYANRAKRYTATIGDGSSTSYAVVHNLGTLDVQVYVYETGGLKREVFVEKQHTSTTTVTIVFDTAPAAGSIRVVVVA